jgi:transcriptional regulator with XRE-family HTH domain
VLTAIKKYRIKLGISQTKLADKLDVSQQAVASWENGERSPSTDKLPDLAKILGCSIDDLYDSESA